MRVGEQNGGAAGSSEAGVEAKGVVDLSGDAGGAEGEQAGDWWAGLAGGASCLGAGDSLWEAGEVTLGGSEARVSVDSAVASGI